MAKKGKKSGIGILGIVLFALVVVGLILVIVGMFVGQVVFKYQKLEGFKTVEASESIKLFANWSELKVGAISLDTGLSNVFSVVSFIVTLVGLAVLAADACLRLFAKKDFKIVRFIGVALSFVGAILILVSGLVLAKQCWGDENTTKLLEAIKASFSAGVGVWLGFIGGLVGTVGGALAIFKK